MEDNICPPDQTQVPNPNISIDPSAQFHNAQLSSDPNCSYYPPQPAQNPNPNLTDPKTSMEYSGVPSSQSDASLCPPGVDSYVSMNALQPPLAGYETQPQTAAAYHEQMQNWAAATFYQDPNAVSQNWTDKDVITQLGTDPVAYADASVRPPNETESLVPVNLNPAQWTNPVVQSYMNGALKKGSKKKKKTKIVQSAYCEVCKIDCNSRDVLDQHKLGKKHKKNLEKIEEVKRNVNQPAPAPAPAPTLIGPLEKPSKRAAAAAASKEDLDTKRRKLMEGGAAAEAVRICTVCNVACNSQTVFNYHLAGQKHASMVKKLAAG